MQGMLGQDNGADDNRRLMIAIALSAIVYLGWMYFFGPRAVPLDEQAPPPENNKVVIDDDEQPDRDADGDEAVADPTPAVDENGNPVEKPPARPVTPDTLDETLHKLRFAMDQVPGQAASTVTGDVELTFSSHGGQLVRYALTAFGDHSVELKEGEEAPPIDLAHAKSDDGAQLLALKSRGGDVKLKSSAPFTVVDESEKHITFQRETKSGVVITRTISVADKRFGLDEVVTFKNNSDDEKTVSLDLALVGEAAKKSSSLFAPPMDPLTAHCRNNEDRESVDPSDLEDGPFKMLGPVVSAGIGWQYFLAAILPGEGTTPSSCEVVHKEGATEEDNGRMTVVVSLDDVTLAPGAEKTARYHAYLGPKQLQLLEAEGAGLHENIDFGIFGILSRPILWTLVKLYGFAGNFGIAIILLTLLIKLLTFPLTQKSYSSMQQMKKVAPEMKNLQAKYGHDRAVLGQKQMEFYKQNGINPMAGCFPMLIQMPIWFALYRTLWSSVELYQQPFWGWINDLSRPDMIPGLGIAILPFVVGALMFAQTLMQPPPEDQPQMKYVMYAMPVMFMFFMLGMPSGLSLYMITNSALTMAQQFYIKKKFA